MATIPTKDPTTLNPAMEGGGEPAWDIAKLFPLQGHWSESDYLRLNGNYLVEFTHGHVEVLPMPTQEHQRILLKVYALFMAFAASREIGEIMLAPFRVRIAGGEYREPDLAFMFAEHRDRQTNDFWESADLVMEIVGDDYRKHDPDTKRRHYARAGIPEYWIVDPMLREITVLKLAGERYDVRGVFRLGDVATSELLPGLGIEVAAVFAAGKRN